MTEPTRPSSFSRVLVTSLCALAFAVPAFAGHEVSKSVVEKDVAPEPAYEAGRGLITFEGPSGMFINPTSATLPQGAFTWQYCLLFVDSDADLIGHQTMMAYGVTDWLEVGALANLVDLNEGVDREFALGGALVRVRLLKDEGWVPQLSVGAYGKYGTIGLQKTSAFLAAYKRVPLDEDGFFKSLGFHAGVRAGWYHEDVRESNTVEGYAGMELQLPGRIYLVGEIGTRGNDQSGQMKRTPYAFGVQWRAGGINLSVAMMQPGTTKELSIFSGIGTAIQF